MSHILRSSFVAACITAIAVSSHARAQTPLCAGATPALHPAPVATLQSARPADGTLRYEMTSKTSGDTVRKPLGTMTVTQATTRCGTDGVVQRVIVYDYGAAGRVTDTTLSVASTLAPILEHTRKSSGDIMLDFSNGLVRGSMARKGTTREIHDTLAAPAFNSTDLELVVRSLALTHGMSTVIQIYDPEYGGYRPDSLTVVQLDPARTPDTEGVWVLRSKDRRLQSTYRFGEKSRRLLSDEVSADSTTYYIVLAGSQSASAQSVTWPGTVKLQRPPLVSSGDSMHLHATPPTSSAEREFASVGYSTRQSPDAEDQLILTLSWVGKSTQYYDTIAVHASTLLPIWERSSWDGSSISVAYDGAKIHATRTPKDSAAITFDTVFNHSVFAFVEAEQLVSALPLRSGYETILPLYSESDRDLELDTVSVIGDARKHPGAPHATWTVRFADPAVVAIYEIDAITRETVAYSVTGRRSGSRIWRVGRSPLSG